MLISTSQLQLLCFFGMCTCTFLAKCASLSPPLAFPKCFPSCKCLTHDLGWGEGTNPVPTPALCICCAFPEHPCEKDSWKRLLEKNLERRVPAPDITPGPVKVFAQETDGLLSERASSSCLDVVDPDLVVPIQSKLHQTRATGREHGCNWEERAGSLGEGKAKEHGWVPVTRTQGEPGGT